jgi:hypothetical protein
MMVQDIANPEYILQQHDNECDECDNDEHHPPQLQCWAERTPIYLVPYPQATTTNVVVRAKIMPAGVVTQHRDKRPKLLSSEEGKTRNNNRRHGSRRHPADPRADNDDQTIRAHFYFDQYPSEPAQERLKINELVDVVAVRALSSSSPASTSSQRTSDTWPEDNDDEDAIDDDDAEAMKVTQEEDQNYHYGNNNETAADGEWHVLWYRRRSLYDGIIDATATTTTPLTPPPPSQRPDFDQASLADQALALLVHSRTEKRTASGPATVDPHSKRVGCATLRWIVRDVHQRDALLRALPAPYTILHSNEVVMTTTTTTTIDEKALTPRRDTNTGRLRHSPLQLPAGALLVLDLTDIAANTATGATASIVLHSAVRNVLATHQLDYCFDGGVKILFEADYRILVITTPHLHCHDFLPPDSTFTIEAPPPPDLFGPQPCQDRLVTTGLPRLPERVELPGNLLESVVQSYAAFSSITAGQKKSEDLLHRWLIATRSIARYHGHSTATLADFAMACRVEDQLQASVIHY